MGERVLGLDFGEKTMGISISDETRTVAQPLQTLKRIGLNRDLSKIAQLVQEHQIKRIVLGLPLNMDGSPSEMSNKVLDFQTKLQEKVSLPVETWDERWSSLAAEKALIEGNVRRKKRKQVIDKVAAALILQGWLDAHSTKQKES